LRRNQKSSVKSNEHNKSLSFVGSNNKTLNDENIITKGNETPRSLKDKDNNRRGTLKDINMNNKKDIKPKVENDKLQKELENSKNVIADLKDQLI